MSRKRINTKMEDTLFTEVSAKGTQRDQKRQKDTRNRSRSVKWQGAPPERQAQPGEGGLASTPSSCPGRGDPRGSSLSPHEGPGLKAFPAGMDPCFQPHSLDSQAV